MELFFLKKKHGKPCVFVSPADVAKVCGARPAGHQDRFDVAGRVRLSGAPGRLSCAQQRSAGTVGKMGEEKIQKCLLNT